jgi:DNA processing protein
MTAGRERSAQTRGGPRERGSGWPPGFIGTQKDREALLILLHLASLTARRLQELASLVGTASACLRAVRSGEAGTESDRSWSLRLRPADVVDRLNAVGASLVAVGDPEYPSELLDLFDPPAGLFVRGSSVVTLRPRVAVVGARNCSAAGGEIASALAEALARTGVCVVSGAARGIDSSAHESAIAAGGPTVAVLGSGIDVAYPRKNRQLIEGMVGSGAVLSEYPPGTPAEPFRFPARNRIVAALCSAVVIVEGAAGSGAMITAEHALDLGRDIFAVPGAPSTALAHVPLTLIREGATLIRGPQDLLEDLGLRPLTPEVTAAGRPEGDGASRPADLSSQERAVWDALTAPVTPDGLARATGLPLPSVLAATLGLELRDLVRQQGGRYERRPEAECR